MRLIRGECVEEMAKLDAACVDAVVTDPPYGLEFMGKEWDRLDGGFSKPGIGKRKTEWPSFGGDQFGGYNPTCATCGGRARGKRKCECVEPEWKVKGESLRELAHSKPGNLGGFANGDKPSFARTLRHLPQMQEWHQRWAVEAIRVLKPGGYLLAFGGTRTFHRLACALEDAGLELRDTIMWLHGQGFPKGDGCLKPSWEPVVLARKPGPRVLPLNIDGCRIGTSGGSTIPSGMDRYNKSLCEHGYRPGEYQQGTPPPPEPAGRWPANVAHDGSDEVLEAFAAFGESKSQGGKKSGQTALGQGSGWNKHNNRPTEINRPTDAGTPARFFYCAKASKSDRGEGNTHPTVKPSKLVRWLVKLVSFPGQTVLDCFMGSGTTGVACVLEGREFIGIERDPAYYEIASKRLAAAGKGDLFAAPSARPQTAADRVNRMLEETPFAPTQEQE